MTMTSSAPAALFLLLFAGAASAETYVGAGIASFGGATGWNDSSDGFEVFAGKEVRPWLDLEIGVIDQHGDYRVPGFEIEVPHGLTTYDWRAVHAGPRFHWQLGERWQLRAGVSLSHVSSERSRFGVTGTSNDDLTFFRTPSYQDSSWGALGTLAVSFDFTPSQRLSLDFKRLHGGLGERCESRSGVYECGMLDHQSADGLSLAWSVRFD
jgi:hypothetical protein